MIHTLCWQAKFVTSTTTRNAEEGVLVNEEGLLILVQAYDKLGLNDLRNDAERVMKTNFPNSKYLSGKFDNSKPWWQLWNW